MTLRGLLYGWARFLGDANAVRRGPKAMKRWVERRIARKITGRLLGRMFR